MSGPKWNHLGLVLGSPRTQEEPGKAKKEPGRARKDGSWAVFGRLLGGAWAALGGSGRRVAAVGCSASFGGSLGCFQSSPQ